MRKSKRALCAVLLAAVLLCAFAPVQALANAAEPPGFTVIVLNAPEDLRMSLRFVNGGEAQAITLRSERKAWETYYRFYYGMTTGGRGDIAGASLVACRDDGCHEMALPDEAASGYNTYLTLDMKTMKLTVGQAPLRVPLLVAMRVLLTLLIEGAVFFLFGYRRRSSWIVFLALNLITQTGLNALITGPLPSGYWQIGFVLAEAVILCVEVVVLVLAVKERGRGRAALCAAVANIASLLLGGALIALLPV